MFFSIQNTAKLSPEILRIRAIARARQIIFLFPINETERAINDYLLKTYNITLRIACMQVLLNGKFMQNNQNELIFVITDKYWDTVASIITYGPDGLCGSKILQEALRGI